MTESGEETGDLLLWVLIASEMVAFGLLLGAFVVAFAMTPEVFSMARLHLDPRLAAANTLVLLTSGFLAALAARAEAGRGAQRGFLGLAALFGFLFVAIKLHDYAGEIRFAGEAAFGAFFELYFIVTGFHLAHVAFAGLLLVVVAIRPCRAHILPVVTLWHMIDLVWIVMFPIIYLV